MNKSVHGKAATQAIREEAKLVVNVFRGAFIRRGRKELELHQQTILCQCWIQCAAGTAVNNDAPGQEDAKLMSISG